MLTRHMTLATAVTGAVVGVLVLGVAFVLAGWWYASAAGLVVLILTPGMVVGGMLNPISTGVYFLVALVVQAITYAAVAVLLALVYKRVKHAGPNAV